MLKIIAMIFGIIMLFVGILGFFPQITPKAMLLGIFHVNAEHNWIHIVTGLLSLFCGVNSDHASRFFFQIFGIVYGAVAVLGFFYGDTPIFGFVANNFADTILHVVIAILSLSLGFGTHLPNGRARHHDSYVSPPRDRDL